MVSASFSTCDNPNKCVNPKFLGPKATTYELNLKVAKCLPKTILKLSQSGTAFQVRTALPHIVKPQETHTQIQPQSIHRDKAS